MSPLILIIEDEDAIRKFLSVSLTDADYRINLAASGEEGIRLAVETPPDLVILDLGLPGIDGQDVIAKLREWSKVPILVLSARDQEFQKIRALDLGADDYVTKPFSVGEVLARIRVALRHGVTSNHTTNIVKFSNVVVDMVARTVTRDEQAIHLTPLEYRLLITMIQHSGKVLTHRFLLREVWGPSDTAEAHYVRVFVANLRRKLEVDSARPRHFLTEPGVGYRFVHEPT